MDKVLIILPTWVGDYVMATPLLRTLREHYSDSRMIYLHEPNLTDLISGCPWPDMCIALPAKNKRHLWHGVFRQMLAQLRREQIDIAILLPNSFRAAATAFLTGAKQRIGYDRDGRRLLLTRPIPVVNRRENWDKNQSSPKSQTAEPDRVETAATGPSSQATLTNLGWQPSPFALRIPPELPTTPGRFIPMRMVDYYAGIALAVGAIAPGQNFELHTTQACNDSLDQKLRDLHVEPDRLKVVLSPGAKFGAAKCWPADRFASAADYLVKHYGAEILITCGPGEEPIARAIGHGMTERRHVLDDPRLSLGELKSLIATCDLLVCNDAGPRHFAKAFGKPVVTLYGPTHPEWTATDYDLEQIVRLDVDCGPCQQRVCPLDHHRCMTELSVARACQAADYLLRIRLENRKTADSKAARTSTHTS